jgi:flagellar basal-body rod modification protein FlgD
LPTGRAGSVAAQVAQSFYWTAAHGPAETEGMTTLPTYTAPPAAGSSAASSKTAKSKGMNLKTEDFIKMMITQLQNQDPLEPAKNQELLAQMSQIGQLQSSTSLTDSLKGMVLQNQIGSASALIGKTVQGLDGQDDPVTGLVNSVKVGADGVSLELDNGKSLMLSRVTQIAPTATTH